MSLDESHTGIDRTVILEQARDRRADCYEAMASVRAAMDRPLTDPAEWRTGLRTSLAGLSRALDAHLAVTETAGGLLDRMAEEHPYLAAASTRLRAEHVALREEIGTVIRLLGTVPALAEENARRRVIRILHRVARHRRAGTDLISEALEFKVGLIAS